ncbi:sensor histidine kinase [Streptomyces sp. NPDC090052]|uniref:sensor histidine kinase n=1 Tax=unclassified Streptomyces TaxID=2593676 RepID=UPI002259749B|nr:histidine kinase [Streptomyces sp. NBC_01306]MCX4722872.1 histidine kinase [Streptomyces sp. NBC_01306]WSX47186.1 histidine kinase [Streptomyces sp. NBC_00963]WSX71974.1 histidine kinase [Streptomyces sp. NBC_00932]
MLEAANGAVAPTAARGKGRSWLLPVTAWLLLVGGLAGLVLLDWVAGFYWVVEHGPAKLVGALLGVGLVVASPRLGSRALPVAACVLAVESLCLSVWLHVEMDVGSQAMGFAEPAALVWLLLLVARRGKPSWATLAVLLLGMAVVLRPVSVAARQSTFILALLFALAAVTALGIGLGMRLLLVDRRRQAAALRLEQRTEFARDLHDFVAHHVTGIVVQAQGAQVMAGRRPELVPPALQRIEQAGSEALTSMRHMVGMLRDADGEVALTPLAGIGEVRSLVEEFSAVGGARARLDLQGTFDDLPVEVTTTAHRVVMEALTNVRKHAHGCTEVLVRVGRSGDRLTVRVSDDGRPRHVSHGGFGLKGLAERVGLIGGSVQAGPVTAGGWGVEAMLPVSTAGVAVS